MMTFRFLLALLLVLMLSTLAYPQAYALDIARDSARSDKRTGGRIQKAVLVSGDADIRISINLPAFQMTLWQNGREIRSYPIGIGLTEFPVPVSMRRATSIDWNPVWIPPSSDWIEKSSTVKAGEIVLPTDSRNPLGKIKIPLGNGYLIHQAKEPDDLGNLVSHGCVRVLQSDLYDLTDKIVTALELDVTPAQIAAAKRSKKTLVARLDPFVSVEITYDTMVVEAGTLRIYPDIYGFKKNTIPNLRQELRSNNIDDSKFSDAVLSRMIASAKQKNQFVISLTGLRSTNVARAGRVIPVLGTLASSRSSKER